MESAPLDRKAEEVLAGYVAVTSGDAGPDAVREFAAWIAADPERERILRDLRLDDDETRALRVFFGDEIRQLRQTRRHRRRWVAALACAATVAGLVIGLGWRTHEVPPGQSQSIALADGSTMVVAGGGAVRVPLAPWRRTARLLRGEALFSVTHDDDAVFTVRCGDAVVEDIGTRFVVRADGGGPSVAVFEGSVRVSTGLAERVLDAGQAVAARPDGIVALPGETEADATAWRQGRMVLRDVPLPVAAHRLSTAWGRPVRLGAPALDSLRVSGSFRLDDQAGVLRGLSLTLPVTIRQSADGIDLLPR
ncbi:MAG: FecR family protein [Bacteroidota bacterium]